MSTTQVISLHSGYPQPTVGIAAGSATESAPYPRIRVDTVTHHSTTGSFVVIHKPRFGVNLYPTNPLSYEASLGLHSQLASIFIQYDIKDINSEYIQDYLKLDSAAIKLLKFLPESIKAIFGDVLVAIKSLTLSEVGDPILEVKIASELPLDEVFDQNERILFNRIDDLSLASALDYIVITYA